MVDYREILRYYSLGYSRKQITLTVYSSHHTVPCQRMGIMALT